MQCNNACTTPRVRSTPIHSAHFCGVPPRAEPFGVRDLTGRTGEGALRFVVRRRAVRDEHFNPVAVIGRFREVWH